MGRRTAPLLWTLLLAALAAGCASGEAQRAAHRPDDRALVETVGAGFRAAGNGLVYTMHYRLFGSFDGDLRAVAEFENPQRGGTPLVTEVLLPAGETRIVLESEPLFTIRNQTDYAVELRLYHGDHAVVTHRDRVRFSVPEGMVDTFRARGIEVE